ncbi:protein IMPACT-like isoform X2 [Branchiostoma lanceolatum]|uniref:protein IMPACT-like isoform X2 n=1 Tax=Branchiostoma lanceolatum TaxID=7740 RepID=UPI0034538CC8
MEAESDDNLASQVEEIEALSAIYGDEWCVVDEVSRVYCIQVTDGEEKQQWALCLQVILPTDYPRLSPPIYELKQNIGEPVLFLWVERVREFLLEKGERDQSGPSGSAKKSCEEEDAEETVTVVISPASSDSDLSPAQDEELPPIHHGEPVTDKRSTFQAHLAPVVSVRQVKLVQGKLMENKKIANATHNIMAYRIFCEDRNSFIQDCDDDGETAAGGRMLHIMEILDVRNVLVIVSRWYGGIHLGPDRFKHINNCTRNILDTCGYLEAKDDGASKGKKTKSKKSK